MDDIHIEEENNGVDDKVKKIKEQLKKCQKERDEYLDGWQRAKADFVNARKDEEKMKADIVRFANQIIFYDLLTALDSFDVAIRQTRDVGENDTTKGFYLIKTQLDDILKKHGLTPINATGQKFNPEFHEAMAEEKSDKEDGTILEEFQKGYMLYDKVLRPARVKVSKN